MILITGGIKSGKSSQALKLAMKYEKRAFIATAEPIDDEMRKRIEKHKLKRGNLFDTYEEPVYVPKVLKDISPKYDTIVLECITTYLGNLFHYDFDIELLIGELLNTISGKEIIVTNEVGLGVIPTNELSRRYVDTLGELNARLASMADEVYFMVSGLKMRIK